MGTEMDQTDRDFIHGIARFEQKLRQAEVGDLIRAVADHGVLVGWVESVNGAEPGEGNHVVMIDVEAVEGDAEGADKHSVTIDYEGAATSLYDYYVPYVAATAGQATLGDVQTLETRRLEPSEIEWESHHRGEIDG